MTIPLYRSSGFICLEACCTCNNNFTLSRGATTVFETVADMPPARKSTKKDLCASILEFLRNRIDIPSNWQVVTRLKLKPHGFRTFLIITYAIYIEKLDVSTLISVERTKLDKRPIILKVICFIIKTFEM